MNEFEKIAEFYMDTAEELVKAAAEEGVDLNESMEGEDDETIAEFLDAAVEDRLAAMAAEEGEEEVEAGAFLFKTAELLDKAAKYKEPSNIGNWFRTKGVQARVAAANHPKTLKGLKVSGIAGAGVGAGMLAHKLLSDRKRK